MSTIRGENINLIRPELIHVHRKQPWQPMYDQRPRTKCCKCHKLFYLIITNRRPQHPKCETCKLLTIIVDALKYFINH